MTKATKEQSRTSRSNVWFGGKREAAIKRDGEKCVECGMTRIDHCLKYNRDITVDHIDGKGRNTAEKNNNLDNLQTLCLPCHGKKDITRRKRKRVSVEQMLAISKDPRKQLVIAQEYGISQSYVSYIKLIESVKRESE